MRSRLKEEGCILGCVWLSQYSNFSIYSKFFFSESVIRESLRIWAVRSNQVRYNAATQDFSCFRKPSSLINKSPQVIIKIPFGTLMPNVLDIKIILYCQVKKNADVCSICVKQVLYLLVIYKTSGRLHKQLVRLLAIGEGSYEAMRERKEEAFSLLNLKYFLNLEHACMIQK